MTTHLDKQQIHTDLVAHLRHGSLADEAEANAEGAAALVEDQPSAESVDDVSHEGEAGDLHGLMGAAAERAHDTADAAARLDVAATDVVRPGAVVEMDGSWFVVGVAASSFTSGGVEYTGISTDAPIFAALDGARAGDTVTVGGHEHHVTSVH